MARKKTRRNGLAAFDGLVFNPRRKRARKSGRSTTHLKKYQARAAKAMRLHHREGISLKAAWKRV